jgi:murein L,D-transpeptidase YafK
MRQESQPVDEKVPETVAPASTTQNEVAQALKAWSTAWSGQNIQTYLNSYAPEFAPADGSKRETWASRRKDTISRAKSVALEITGIQLSMRDALHASTSFRQSYSSSTYRDIVKKTLEWEKQNNQWLITSESSETLNK